ncbi:MAG: gephyrin-like molybdotransferase Glp [Gemmatimonadota bacterium]
MASAPSEANLNEDWLSYRPALELTLARCQPLAAETVDLTNSLGRVLAGAAESRIDHPPWDNSAMDGFAVQERDVRGATPESPQRLPVAEEVAAGAFPSGPLASGTAVRVMTGAPVPAGATGVIRIEHTDGGQGGYVEIRRDSDAARNIRGQGEDIRRGQILAAEGDEISAPLLGLLAMNGMQNVSVRRRPKIGVLSNGDELADLDDFGEVLEGRKIMNSNMYAVAAQLREFGADPVYLGIARDTSESVTEKLRLAEGCDGVVSTAGVSVGDHDCIRDVLAALGMERLFWRVRIRPGSPMTFGVLDGKPFWGLPGNPVSAMVTSELFVRPAIRKMLGCVSYERSRRRVRLAESIRSTPDLAQYYRVTLAESAGDELPVAHLTGPQGSGILSSMAAADGLLVVPEGIAEMSEGRVAEFLPLR